MNLSFNPLVLAQILGQIDNQQFQPAINALIELAKAHPQNKEVIQLISRLSNALPNKNQSADFLKSCIQKNPTSSALLYELGSLYLSLGMHIQAIPPLECALEQNPNSFEVLHDLGAAFALSGNKTKALEFFLCAFHINDQSADLSYNLARLYDEIYEFEKAIHLYQKAVALDVMHTQAWINLAIDLAVYKKYGESLECFETAYKQNPQIDFLYGDCLYTKMRMCAWGHQENPIAHLSAAIKQGHKLISPFPLMALSDDPAVIQKATQLYSDTKYPENLDLGPLTSHTNPKIRVAYFSPDFHEHPVSYLMAQVFELHNRDQFEIYAFSFGKNTTDAMRTRLMGSFDHFIDVGDKNPYEICTLSRELKIDIAIDLCGYTENARTEIFALRAAPIQVGYIGFLGTMGANYFDYLIADEVIIPPHLRKFYSEKIMYLPSYQANDSMRASGLTVFSKADFGIQEEQFVFCNLNNVYKINEAIFDSWLNILSKTPDSVMLLYSENASAVDNLTHYAITRQVDPSRLKFVERLPRTDYLARYQVADLFLDTYPYNAGTTASDALWMNVPVITLQGESFPSRVASSLLTHLHLPQLIHRTLASYEAQAVELATDPEKLAIIKANLLANKSGAPLFNTLAFVESLEYAFGTAHQLHTNHLPFKDISPQY
jgi:protein O-GlcNAc transferase